MNGISTYHLHGSVPQLINGTLDYLKNNVLREFVVKLPDRAESLRYFNYPVQALEEAVTNAFYHRDYSLYEPVTVEVQPDGITVSSVPGPDRSISSDAIEKGGIMYSRRYRNRRLGDFLKELDLTEGRFTGIPTIQAKLEENGSPRARFITDDTRSYLDVFIPVHETVKSSDIAIKTFDEVENGPNNEPNQGGFDPNSDPNGPNPDPNKLSKRQNTILKTIQLHPEFSRKAIAELTGMSDSTVKREIRFLKESGFIRRDGLTKGGKWIVIREIPMNE